VIYHRLRLPFWEIQKGDGYWTRRRKQLASKKKKPPEDPTTIIQQPNQWASIRDGNRWLRPPEEKR
jgi:hypothetical protein